MIKATAKTRGNTAETLAGKFRSAKLHRPHITGQTIARACGVTAQAVSGWPKTGRIDKRHLQTLALLFDIPVAWWIDGQANTPIPASVDASTRRSSAINAQESLAFYSNDATVNRLVAAFGQLTTADQERYLSEIEELGARTHAIFLELKSRNSPTANAFRPAVSDLDVERRMNIGKRPGSKPGS